MHIPTVKIRRSISAICRRKKTRAAGRRGLPEARSSLGGDHGRKHSMNDPTESWVLASEGRQTREKVACAGRALTGLMGVFDGLTWACARRTRSSPGFHIWGLQPQRQNSAMHLNKMICAPMAPPKEGVATRDLRGREPAAGPGVCAKRAGLYRPCGAEVLFLRLPWVSRGATHGYSNGIPSGWQGSAPHPHRLRRGRSELPDLGVRFCFGKYWR